MDCALEKGTMLITVVLEHMKEHNGDVERLRQRAEEVRQSEVIRQLVNEREPLAQEP